MLRLLLEKGVDINHQNEVKWTALMVAAQQGSATAVSFLLDHGADPNVKDVQGKTALRMATETGHNNVKELLLRWGAREYRPPCQ